jgi:magnesium-transporting ATPase (P-type)
MSPFLSSNNCGIKDTSVLRSSGVDWCSIAFNFSIIFQLLKLLWVSIKYLKNVALFSLFINGDAALMEHKIVVNYFCVILTYFIVILNKTCRPDTSCIMYNL